MTGSLDAAELSVEHDGSIPASWSSATGYARAARAAECGVALAHSDFSGRRHGNLSSFGLAPLRSLAQS